MPKRGKKYLESLKKIDENIRYDINGAIKIVLENAIAKFDETIDIAVRLGVDPRHSEQMVRGSVILPHGIGKEVKVIVFAKGEKEKEALEAGADFVGNDDLIDKIKKGWFEFDKAVSTPDMMGTVGKIGRLLGPKGLMPNAKTGTITFDVARAVKELKTGKIDFKVEKAGIVHSTMGKASFGAEKILENMTSFFETLLRMKPASSKGTYMKAVVISSTMGPSIKMDASLIKDLIKS